MDYILFACSIVACLIGILTFVVGVANYSENIDQSQMQDTVNNAVLDIHKHLKAQDEKLNLVLSLLEKKGD